MSLENVSPRVELELGTEETARQSQRKMIHRLKEREQHNRARKLAGLPQFKAKNRSCLNCGVVFFSAQEERICGTCSGNN